MTNKQERFLVMSEAEFEAACQANWDRKTDESVKAEAACRAREVEIQLFPAGPYNIKAWVEIAQTSLREGEKE